MRGLNADAKWQLKNAGITQVAWAREHFFDDKVWHGDECGCPDDRCIGFHHDDTDDCGCITSLIAAFHRARPAALSTSGEVKPT